MRRVGAMSHSPACRVHHDVPKDVSAVSVPHAARAAPSRRRDRGLPDTAGTERHGVHIHRDQHGRHGRGRLRDGLHIAAGDQRGEQHVRVFAPDRVRHCRQGTALDSDRIAASDDYPWSRDDRRLQPSRSDGKYAGGRRRCRPPHRAEANRPRDDRGERTGTVRGHDHRARLVDPRVRGQRNPGRRRRIGRLWSLRCQIAGRRQHRGRQFHRTGPGRRDRVRQSGWGVHRRQRQRPSRRNRPS